MPKLLTRPLDPSDLVATLGGIAPHDIRLVVGLTAAALHERLALDPPNCPVLSLDLGAPVSSEQAIDRALEQAARAAKGLWPVLWGGEDFSGLRDDALGRAHLPLRLAALATRIPDLSSAWAADAIARLLQGRPPRVHGTAPELEWAQLARAIAPGGLTIAARLDRANDAAIHALEWLVRHAAVSGLAFSEERPIAPGIERILYGARRLRSQPVDTPPGEPAPGAPPGDAIVLLALPAAPEGQPHPMSAAERKLHRLIQADDELRPLFIFNRTVPLPLLRARVDLVWLGGRVAVEIDGHEHRAAAKFRADRHRDYELMCAGYRVLRMTNEDVETDAALAIEKIRTVARLVREEAG